MNLFLNIADCVGTASHKACTKIKSEVSYVGKAATNLEGFDKLSKLFLSIINAIQFTGFGQCLTLMARQLKDFSEVISGLQLPSRANDWLSSSRPAFFTLKGQKLFWLTIGHVCETIKLMIQELCLSRIKDACMGISSVCSIVSNTQTLHNHNTSRVWKRRKELCNKEIEKWRLKSHAYKSLKAENANLNEIFNKYHKRIVNRKQEVQNNRPFLKFEKEKKMEKRGREYFQKQRLKTVELDQKFLQELEAFQQLNETEKENKIQECDWNKKCWRELKKLPDREKEKLRITIINDIFKLTMISLTFISTVLYVATLTPAAFTLFGLISAYVAYRKFCIEDDCKNPLQAV